MCACSQPRIERTSVELDVERQRGRDAVRIDLVRRRGPRARGRSGGCRARRSARPCPRSTGSSAGPTPLITPVNIGERSRPARMMSWVRALVCVIQHGSCARMHVARAQEREHRRGIVAGLHLEHREVDRAAVEARRRAGLEPADRQLRARAAARPGAWPADRRRAPPRSSASPTWISPDRNVPVVRTTASAWKRSPICVTTPVDAVALDSRSSTACWNSVRFGWFSSRRRIAALVEHAGRPARGSRAPPAPCSR